MTGDRLIVDFEGSDTRQDIAAWSTYGNTRGNVLGQLMSMVDPTIPKNEGFFDCVELRVPEGCCLNPPVGKPVSSGTHHPGVEAADAIALAVAKFMPERVSPQTYKYGSPRQMWGSNDPRTGKPFFDHGGEVNAGWCNGIKGADGWGALPAAYGNLLKAPAELNEVNFPHLIRDRNYRTDSGGAGQWRGGLGSHFVKEARTPTYISQYIVNQRHVHPGIAGGAHGSPDEAIVSRGTDREVNVSPVVNAHLLQTGEALTYNFGGGGGWGDALLRDANAVLEDVWDEYVSVEGARRDYGVVVTGSVAGHGPEAGRGGHRNAPRRDGRPQGGGMTMYRVGVDVGGTFTDCVLLRPDGSLVLEKVPTTPADQSGGVLDGLGRLAEAEGLQTGRPPDPDRVHRPRHHRRRQRHDPDARRQHGPDRHPRLPRRDRAPSLLQGRHLGPGLSGPSADRQAPCPPGGGRADDRGRPGRDGA